MEHEIKKDSLLGFTYLWFKILEWIIILGALNFAFLKTRNLILGLIEFISFILINLSLAIFIAKIIFKMSNGRFKLNIFLWMVVYSITLTLSFLSLYITNMLIILITPNK